MRNVYSASLMTEGMPCTGQQWLFNQIIPQAYEMRPVTMWADKVPFGTEFL